MRSFEYTPQIQKVEIEGKEYGIDIGDVTPALDILNYVERMQQCGDEPSAQTVRDMADEGVRLLEGVLGEDAGEIIKGRELNIVFMMQLMGFILDVMQDEEVMDAYRQRIASLSAVKD